LNPLDELNLAAQLAQAGYAFTTLDGFKGGMSRDDSAELKRTWHDLPLDPYLADGGRYRARRHASLTQQGQHLTLVPYRPHWQPTSYNAMHGGMLRAFSEIEHGVLLHRAFRALTTALGLVFNAASGQSAETKWFIEAHQFRIDPSHGVGKPTPEGAHRDGVDYVALLLLDRVGIEGGVTTILTPDKTLLATHCLMPNELMLLDDVRVIHETTVIKATAALSYRDSLVLTYRRAGFMDPV
jgi:hypothetical protein